LCGGTVVAGSIDGGGCGGCGGFLKLRVNFFRKLQSQRI
jgi:hypothetical protein